MFLSLLNTTEKMLFLEAANQVIISDGRIDDVEGQLLQLYKNEMGIPNEYTVKNISMNRILSEITNEQTKKIFLIELMSLCFINNEFSFAEKEILKELCVGFDIDEQKCGQYEKWVKQFLDVYLAGIELIRG